MRAMSSLMSVGESDVIDTHGVPAAIGTSTLSGCQNQASIMDETALSPNDIIHIIAYRERGVRMNMPAPSSGGILASALPARGTALVSVTVLEA